jgi:CheY-like chemotaxis protein
MDAIAKLISALASLAWPIVLAVLLYKLYEPIRTLVESARGRKFTIKVGGNELTMEEVSEQQRAIVSDLQTKIAEIEKRVHKNLIPLQSPINAFFSSTNKHILWVDDHPKNNSFFVAAFEERGARVDIALSTDEAIAKIKKTPYDIVLSDMGRPEGDKAGIDLTRKLKELRISTPVYIYCGSWAAQHLRDEALAAGVAEITSSGTTLLSVLPLVNES